MSALMQMLSVRSTPMDIHLGSKTEWDEQSLALLPYCACLRSLTLTSVPKLWQNWSIPCLQALDIMLPFRKGQEEDSATTVAAIVVNAAPTLQRLNLTLGDVIIFAATFGRAAVMMTGLQSLALCSSIGTSVAPVNALALHILFDSMRNLTMLECRSPLANGGENMEQITAIIHILDEDDTCLPNLARWLAVYVHEHELPRFANVIRKRPIRQIDLHGCFTRKINLHAWRSVFSAMFDFCRVERLSLEIQANALRPVLAKLFSSLKLNTSLKSLLIDAPYQHDEEDDMMCWLNGALKSLLVNHPSLQTIAGLATIFGANVAPILAEAVAMNRRLLYVDEFNDNAPTRRLLHEHRCAKFAHEHAWQGASMVIGFLRANAKHALRYSILALLRTIHVMANDEYVDDFDRDQYTVALLDYGDAMQIVKQRAINCDRFISTRFCIASC